jgi:serine/threonine protein kinase
VFPSIEQHRALKGFEILERLGSGGGGEVFLGKSKAGRLVAIKVLSDARERDEAFSDALAREASLCVRLTHPAIVQVRAFVEDEGFAAIVFDYVEGIALARLLRFCSALGARLPDRIGWHVVERVLAALSVAHAQKDDSGQPAPIVHRDVSPSNVLISFQGDVKLTDFGIAKMLGVSPATRLGLVKGTLGCMAPEQARGEPVDERADVYAAGLLAWRLGTGRAPFQQARNEDLELLRAMRYPRIKPLAALRPDLPERLCLAVAAALAPEAQYRTIRAEELASEVRASIDVDRGRAELGELLHLWRGPLERPHAGGSSSTDSSGNHKHATMNYEQVAALDDEPEVDGPTVETHALPGDEVMWKALALNGSLDLARAFMADAKPAPPRDPPRARPSDPERTAPTVRPTERAQTRAAWRLQLILLALLAMVVGGAVTWLAHKALRAWGASVSSQSGTE